MVKLHFLVLCTFTFFIANCLHSNHANGQTPKDSLGTQPPCMEAYSQIDLDINNVRTTLLNDGTLWWNLSTARYEIPKGSETHAVFCGGLWIGGIAAGQLRIAAQTYRQSGSDFWPGPLDNDGMTDSSTCNQFDRH